MNVKGFYTGLAAGIQREERIKVSATERAEIALALWDVRSKTSGANPRFLERGQGVAANLRGTPYKDCALAQSLVSDLEWITSKL